MSNLEWALRSIQSAPKGPRVGAFFDLDGTLVKGFTALAFLWDNLSRGEIPPQDLVTLTREGLAHRRDPEAGLSAIEKGVELMAGRELETLQSRSKVLFRKQIGSSIRPDARRLVRAHREAGHTLVLASAATPFQAEPVAWDLGIDHMLTTELEVKDGRLTGKIRGRPRWGSEKARAVSEFAQAHQVDLGASFAYGNGVEDQEFLRTVGRPVAVRPDSGLSAVARSEGIPVLDLEDPPQPGWRGLVGTLGAIGAFNAGLVGTAAATLLVGKKTATEFGFSATAQAALAAAGVEVRAEGVEHIEAARPAVFIMNHQSNLDPLVAASLIPGPLTGVGKQELANDLRGLALRLFDVALIDRSDSARAQASVNALVQRIHGGESVLIAPEGTRMPTPNLGAFKRGAFHLAYDAQVPLVPIVIRNTGELWARGKALISSGVVDVRVLPPIPTVGWSKDNIGKHADAVRALFAKTLELWPRYSSGAS